MTRTAAVYAEAPIAPPELARCTRLSGAISWLMLITQIRSRMTTTRSSRTPSSPQKEGSVSRGLSVEERGSKDGEDMDIMAPTQHSATLKTNIHTRPPMVPSPRNSNCRSRGASHRYSITWRACTEQIRCRKSILIYNYKKIPTPQFIVQYWPFAELLNNVCCSLWFPPEPPWTGGLTDSR